MRCCRRTLVGANQWRQHVAPQSSVPSMYRALVQKGILQHDAAQVQMCELCMPLLGAVASFRAGSTSQEGDTRARLHLLKVAARSFLALAARLRTSLVPGKETSVEICWPENLGAVHSTGLYIWGDVGIGKTMVLDLFELCPTPGFCKRRAHLHSFMTELHSRLHAAEAQRKRPDLRPIEEVTEEILAETPILLFDEFQTFDVAHAALLGSFFREAFKRGVFLLTTSNRPPHELGLLSESFQTLLPLLEKHCVVAHCKAARDYRGLSSRCCHALVFLHPASEINALKLVARVEHGIGSQAVWESCVRLTHFGREVVVPRRCGGVAVFHFAEICGSVQPLGPVDFSLLVRTFHTIVILQVPQIGAVTKNAAKQFIVLVDEMYQHRVKLLITSVVPWTELMDEPVDGVVAGEQPHGPTSEYFAEGVDERSAAGATAAYGDNEEERLSYARVRSRLREMGTTEYLTCDHSLFVIDDFKLSTLVNGESEEGSNYRNC